MMSVVITIIIVIIMAMIFIPTSSQMPDEANYATFAEEIKNLEEAVQRKRLTNASKGDTEEKINAGFKKVTLKSAPANFQSFDRTGIEVTGYVVDLEEIQYMDAEFGHDFDIEKSELEFRTDDVYVYDSTGTIYYVKGTYYQDELIHTTVSGADVGLTSTADGPIISNIVVTSGELEDGTPTRGKAKIIVTAFPRKGGELTVMVRETIAEKQPDETFATQVSRNGVYTVVVTEENGGRTVQKITISEIIESNEPPSNLSIVVNGGNHKVTSRIVNVAVRADGATHMIITQDDPLRPSSSDARWETYQTNFTYDLGSRENRITLYAWFKDEFENVTDQIVKATVIYDKTNPSTNHPDLTLAGAHIIVDSRQEDNVSSDEYILSTTEYGYVMIEDGYAGVEIYEDEYIWSSSQLIGPLENGKTYAFVTRASDEVGNKSMSQKITQKIEFDYLINFDLNGGVGIVESIYAKGGQKITMPSTAPVREGYKFEGWSQNQSATAENVTDLSYAGEEYEIPTSNETTTITFYAIWSARTDMRYIVNHFIEKKNSVGEYELKLTETFSDGRTGQAAVAMPKTGGDFYGFEENLDHPQRVGMAEIRGDGDTVLSLYYYRKKSDLTLIGENASTLGNRVEVPYETEVSISATPNNGYEFDRWYIDGVSESSEYYNNFINENANYNANAIFKMIGENTTLIAKTKLKKYFITYDLDGGTSTGVNPTEYALDTPAFTLYNPVKSGYEFDGWLGTDLIEATKTVTVDPSMLVNMTDRSYKATYKPTEELLTITATPTELTSGVVRAIVACMDKDLKVEYRVGTNGTWDIYSSSIEITENTIIYARATKDGVLIDEETLVIDNIDTQIPEINDVSISDKWVTGNKLIVKVIATDNNGITGYAVTGNSITPDEEKFQESNDELELSEGINYIWVKDGAGNIVSHIVYMWDISENSDRKIYALFKNEFDLVIKGTGNTISYEEGKVPYESLKSSIQNVSVEGTIESIGNYVLSSMRLVNKISIPSTLKELKEDAISYTNSYEEIEIESGNTSFVYENYTLYDSNKTMLYSHSTKDQNNQFEVPPTVNVIKKLAFYKNNALSSVVTTSNPELEEGAFIDCKLLYKIEGKIGGTSIGPSAFANCENLHLLDISDTLENIGENAFYYTTKLGSILLPKTVTTVVDSNASQAGVFEFMGSLSANLYNKGIVKYYQSSAVMYNYAHKYSAEAHFEMIDDVKPELVSLQITSPSTGSYAQGKIIVFEALFTEEIGITDGTVIPELKIKIGTGSEKIVGTGIIDGDKIVYKYIVEAEDLGRLTLVDYSGTVVDLYGNSNEIQTTTLGGSTITIDTVVKLSENSVVTYYGSIQDAVNSATLDGKTTSIITLLKGTNEAVTVPANKIISLNLSGETFSNDSSNPLITNHGKLEIYGNGTLSSSAGIIVNKTNATLEINNLTLGSSSTTEYAIVSEVSSRLTMSEINITTDAMGVDIYGNALLSDNTITAKIGPVINVNGQAIAEITGSTLNTTDGYGVNVLANGDLTMYSTIVETTSGTAVNNEGELLIADNSELKGSIGLNTKGTATINRTKIEGIDSEKSSIENAGTLEILNSEVITSVSVAIQNKAGTLEIKSSTIETTQSSKNAIENLSGAEISLQLTDVTAVTGRAILNNGKAELKPANNFVSTGTVIIENIGSMSISQNELAATNSTGTALINSGFLEAYQLTIDSSGKIGIDNKGMMILNNTEITIENQSEDVIGVLIASIQSSEIENSTITAISANGRAMGIKINANDVIGVNTSIVTGSSTSAEGYGVYNANGYFTLGNIEDKVSKTTPVIEGSTYGYYSTSGVLNFYDGMFIGDETKSIYGVVTRKPDYSFVVYSVASGRETATIELDESAPTMVLLVANPDTWHNGEIILSGEAIDEDSGIWKYAITTSSGEPTADEWTELEIPVIYFKVEEKVTESNIFYLHVMDCSNNVAVSNAAETKYDPNKPVIENIQKIPDTWTSGDVTIQVDVKDDESGISGYEFSKVYHDIAVKGDGYTEIYPATEATLSEIVSENGTTNIYIYDQAGNVTYQTYEIDNIDKVVPAMRLEFSEYVDNATKMKVTAMDYDSGVQGIYMNGIEQISTGDDSERIAICDIQTSGITTFTVKDNVGNETTMILESYVIEYDSVNAEGTMPYQVKIKDLGIPLLENRFIKDTFEFEGWNTARDYSGVKYNEKQLYEENNNVTLYAMWKDVVPPDVTDVYLSSEWVKGNNIMLEIESTDNVLTTGYAITTDTNEPQSWNSVNKVEIEIGYNTYYVWVTDGTGNKSYEEINVYDLSLASDPRSTIGIVKDFEQDNVYILSIEGKSSIKDFATDEEKPWETLKDKITSIIIKDDVTGIGTSALSNLTKVEDITIGANVNNIALNAFTHTNNYSSIISNSTIYSTEDGILFDKNGPNVYVASTELTKGAVVLSANIQNVAPYTFENSTIDTFYVPNNIDILEGTFYNAANLIRAYTDSKIGGQLIGSKAFEGCTSLEELELSEEVKEIGARAFYGTKKLTDIIIAKTVTSISGNHIFVDIGTEAGTDTGKGYVYYYDSNTLMSNYATNAGTKDQATFIGIDDVKPEVKEVLINNGDETAISQDVTIKVVAEDNREVKEIFITEDPTINPNTDSVSWLEYKEEYEYTLSESTGIHTVYVWARDNSENVSMEAGTDSILLVLYDFEVIGGTEQIQYVELSNNGFYEYRERGYTLSGAEVDVEIRGSVNHRAVDKYSIEYVISYDGYLLETITKNVNVISNSWGTTQITMDDYTFVVHTEEKYAKLIKYVNSSNATVLTIPETITYNGEEYKVIDIGDGNAAITTSDNKIQKVVLSNNVIAVSANAFSTFKAISEIEYSDNLMTFGEYSFANSNSVYTKVTLNDNVREVKRGAFSNTIINEIIIEEGVKSIEEDAFYTLRGTFNGKNLEIPSSLTKIGPGAFAGYRAYKIIVSTENPNYIADSEKALLDKNKTIVYQYALGSSDTEYTVPNGVVTIEKGAFLDADNLRKVTLDANTNSIKAKAFKNAGSLELVLNTSKIDAIYEETFMDTSLTEFEFSQNMVSIGNSAFENTKLKEVHLPEKLETIGSRAFADNAELQSVVMVNAATIEGDTFRYSNALKYLVIIDNTDVTLVNTELKLPSETNVYVTSTEIKTQYENDAQWGTLGTYRIKLLAELIGDANIGLVDNEIYSELGATLLGEEMLTGAGTSSIISNFTMEIDSGADEAIDGAFTIQYYIKYNGDLVMTLERSVRIIDEIPPVISDIITSSSWSLGSILKVDVLATDNRIGDLKYSVTSSEDSSLATWSTSATVTLNYPVNYVHVRDVVGNVTTVIVMSWDMSRNSDKSLYTYVKPNGEIVLTGSGTTKNIIVDQAPWEIEKPQITKITIEEGVISLGEYILAGLENVSEISIPSTLGNSLAIATSAFAGTNNFSNVTIASGNTGLKMEDEYTLTSSNSKIIYMHSRKDPATEYTITSEKTTIAEYAFSKNNYLNSVTMNSLLNIKSSAFAECLNLTTISGEIGNETLGDAVFSGDINLQKIYISKTLKNIGVGVFTKVLGPVYYYASCNVMKEYVATYPTETNFVLIDDVFPTDDKPEVRISSSTIMVESKQTDVDSGIVELLYNIRLGNGDYDESKWQETPYFIGLTANTKYYVRTKATDGGRNTTVSQETEAITAKVPDTITIEAIPTTPTSGDVSVIVTWPVTEMEELYGNGWPAGTKVIKQIGIRNSGDELPTWTDITDDEATYTRTVTANGVVIYARLYDGYNYTTQTISVSVNNIDRIAPTGTVIINNGDEEALVNAVKLGLTATDNRNDTGFGVKFYYASEDPDEDLTTVEWKAYNGNGEYSFELLGTTSVKTVYVWYKDAAGNISNVCSDEILLITDNVRLEQNGVTTYYLSLVDAINATNNDLTTSSKITIIRNLSQDGPYEISASKNILIDMRGNNISQTGSGQIILIKNSGLLTIINSRTNDSGLYAVSNDNEAICIWNEGYLEVNKVSLYADSSVGKSTGIKNKKVQLITFYYKNVAYTAEEGMTWEEWLNSSYNTSLANYSFVGEIVMINTEEVSSSTGVSQKYNMKIISNTYYNGISTDPW